MGTVLCGQSPSTADVNREGDGIPYVSGPEHWDGHKVHLDKWTTAPKRIVPAGCVFVTVKGAGVGTVFPGVDCAIGRDIYAFRPNERVDKRFLEHALRHTAAEVIREARGDIPGLSKSHLLDHEIVLPPIADQHRIVADIETQLSRLEAGVIALKRAQTNLKRYRAAILKAACEGRLVPSEAELASSESRDFETGSQLVERMLTIRRQSWQSRGKYKEPATVEQIQVPAGWVAASLEQVTSKIGDVDHKMPKPAETDICYVSTRDFFGENGINYDRAKRISEGDFVALCRKIKPEYGDLLLSRYGTVGEVRLIEDRRGFQASYSIAIIKCLGEQTLTKFLFYALQAEPVQMQIRRDVRASAQPDLGLEFIRMFVVGIPPLAEQARIVAEVERRLSLVDELEATITANLRRATRLRGAILSRAFCPAPWTGEALLERSENQER
jgi:type I restriction enzyme S subunit